MSKIESSVAQEVHAPLTLREIANTWNTYSVRIRLYEENTETKICKYVYHNVLCVAESLESAIAYVRKYGCPSDCYIESAKVVPNGVMIAA